MNDKIYRPAITEPTMRYLEKLITSDLNALGELSIISQIEREAQIKLACLELGFNDLIKDAEA